MEPRIKSYKILQDGKSLEETGREFGMLLNCEFGKRRSYMGNSEIYTLNENDAGILYLNYGTFDILSNDAEKIKSELEKKTGYKLKRVG